MSNWEQLKDEIYDYVDGLLPAEARKHIEKLLEQDSQAREFHDNVVRLRSGLKGLRRVKVSDDFETVLRTRIRMERSLSRQGFWSGTVRIPAFATVGALALVVLLSFLSFSNSGTSKANSGNLPALSAGYGGSGFVAGRQSNPAVRFVPVDRVNLGSNGTALERLEDKASTPADSIRRQSPDGSRILTVEF